jgi:hypothetical protein
MSQTNRHISREVFADEVARMGRFLDAMDLRQVVGSPSAYRKAAAWVKQYIENFPTCEQLHHVVALSPALRGILENVQMEQAIQGGKVELPEQVLRCLTMGADRV